MKAFCLVHARLAIMFLVHAVASSSLANSSGSDYPLPELYVARVDNPIIIDGLGTASAWEKAHSIELQDLWPTANTSTAQRTRVSLLHDGRTIYIAFDCEDREVKANRTLREDQTFRDDCVEILLGAPIERLADTACLEINALGTIADYYYRHADWINYRFDSTAQVSVSRKPLGFGDNTPGYRVEVAIPFKALQGILTFFPNEGDTEKNANSHPQRIRANFARWDRNGKNLGGDRFTIWSDPQFPYPHPHRPERYGWLLLEGD